MVAAIQVEGPAPDGLQPHLVPGLQPHGEGGRVAAVLVSRGPGCNVETHSIQDVSVELEVNDGMARLDPTGVELGGNDVDTGEGRRVDAQQRVIAAAVIEDHVVKPEGPRRWCCGLQGRELCEEGRVATLHFWKSAEN